MKFLKNFFGLNDDKPRGKTTDHFSKYRNELSELGLSTKQDLKNLLLPLQKKATKIQVHKPSRPPEYSQLTSHFGGDPYFEEGDSWPSSDGDYLSFVFQLYDQHDTLFPSGIKLVQFFYDYEKFPWDTDNDGWLVKIFTDIDPESRIQIPKPKALARTKFCEVSFQEIVSLPDWEGLDLHSRLASNLSCVLDENDPWESYRKLADDIAGEQNYQSQAGGYPNWIQGEGTPKNNIGEPMPLLLQVDSEENAGLMWGDWGLIYIFCAPDDLSKIELTLQCY